MTSRRIAPLDEIQVATYGSQVRGPFTFEMQANAEMTRLVFGANDVLHGLVKTLRVKPGWNIMIITNGGTSRTLSITINTINSVRIDPEGMSFTLTHNFAVPEEVKTTEEWERWLLERCFDVERHEIMEFFSIAGHRPFAPNHYTGDPYAVTRRDP